ncbi:MAG TPA: response regulator, partial [Calditrichaeota bacterium]|nr:response regulator [Calditrichota bacterium]
MKKVLFVDDDPSLISGLKRMLRPLRKEWEMHFVPGGQEALDLLAESRFDVIVSDMRMPGMNGAELLARVRELYPHMIRIILSGYSDQDLLLKAVRPAHQFLSKPCDADTLKNTVLRVSKIQDILNSNEVKQVIAQVDSLPSLPYLYQEIMRKLEEDDTAVKDVGMIIQKDIGMSAQ